MDWKKIFNRKEKNGRKQTVCKPTAGELEEYLRELVTELNFRLFMKGQPERMLWVDGITLTSYEEGEEKPARSREKAGQYFKKPGNRTARFFRRVFSRR